MKKRLTFILCAFLLYTAAFIVSSPTFALERHLRVAFNCNLPPFQFIDEDGISTGMHIEMFDEIAKNKGFQVEYLPFQTNRELIEAIENKTADVLLGVIENTIDNPMYTYSDPLTNSSLCMIAKNTNLTGTTPARLKKTVTTGVFASDTTRNTLLSNMNFYKYICVDNQVNVYARQLQSDDIAMIGIKDSLIYQIHKNNELNEYTILNNHLDTISYTLVTWKSDRELLRTLNEGIAQLKSSPQYEKIYNRWIIVEHSVIFEKILRKLSFAAIAIIAFILLYVIISTRMRLLLKERVEQQTREIQLTNNELEKQLVQIQEENDLRNRIIKYSPNAMLLFDENYIITLINKSACVMANTTMDCIGKSVLSLPVFREILQKKDSAIFTPGITIENRSIRIDVSPGNYQSYRYTMHQVILYGKVVGILLTVQNVTKEDMEKQAAFEEEKNRALTRIVAGIAHEIRNPLMSIRMFATLIGTRGDDKQVQESFAHYVPAEVDRISKLIENLIHYTRPVKRNVKNILLCDILEECLHLLKPLIDKPRILFKQDIDNTLCIIADRDQIKQVMINIIINGIEAIEKKLSILSENRSLLMLSISVKQSADQVVISVYDEGIGMDPKIMSDCTKPFFTTKENGTGIGLALCEQYVSENGGTMEIESVEMEYTKISLLFKEVQYRNES